MKTTLSFAAASCLILASAPAYAQLGPVGQTVSGAVGAATQASDQTSSQAAGQVGGQLDSQAMPPKAPKTNMGKDTSAAASAQTSGTNASVTTGMSVKDKTGATIGEVAGVKTGSDGKAMATIRMGADTFAVDASALAVADGAATVNASQDEIRSMLKK